MPLHVGCTAPPPGHSPEQRVLHLFKQKMTWEEMPHSGVLAEVSQVELGLSGILNQPSQTLHCHPSEATTVPA